MKYVLIHETKYEGTTIDKFDTPEELIKCVNKNCVKDDWDILDAFEIHKEINFEPVQIVKGYKIKS